MEFHYIQRSLEPFLRERLAQMPAVAILGARQSGKSTLVKQFFKSHQQVLYIDLEKPSDRLKVTQDPEAFFKMNQQHCIALDEIQLLPELFPLLRSVLDENGGNGQMLLLGSASRDLIQKSSETLAGRIAYLELPPFHWDEVSSLQGTDLRTLWLRGGFPRSLLAADDPSSFMWRHDFLQTYLYRDLPQLGVQGDVTRFERFLQMCAHYHGSVLNSSQLGNSLGINHQTVRSYLDILEQTFLIRLLKPFEGTLKKRLVKSPKVYFRDSGILHSLLSIQTQNNLLGHPKYGESWEGMVIEHLSQASSPYWTPYFYRTSNGSEIDLILERGMERVAFEIKASSAPTVSRGFWKTLEELQITKAWVIAPIPEPYPIGNDVYAAPLSYVLQHLH